MSLSVKPHLLFVSLAFVLIGVKEVQGQVLSLTCGGINNTFSASGIAVSFNCTVETNSLSWTLPSSSIISFGGAGNNPGDGETKEGFTATYTQEDPDGMSTLDFTLTESLNGTNVSCQDFTNPISQSCYILVIGRPNIPFIDSSIISSTYESVMLQWSPPSFNGGSEITHYIINVTPLRSSDDSTCPEGQCNTTGLSFNVTGLTPNVQYQFNISAVNSAGEGDAATISVTTVGVVFPALTDAPQLCLNYTDNDGLQLLVSWNCSSAISNTTTPPLTTYAVCINNDCSMVSSGSCSLSVPVNCSDTYNVNVSLNNIIGSSGPSPIASINTNILQPSMVDMITNESVRITYTPFIACDNTLSSGTIDITLNNMNTSSMDTRPSLNYNTNGVVTIGSLNASTMYSYSLSLIINGNDVCDGAQMGNFITIDTGDNGGGNPTSPSPTPTTSDPTEASTTLSSFTSSLTLSPTLSTTPPPSLETSGGFPTGAVIGVAVGAALIILGIVIILIAVCCYCKKKDKSVNFDRNRDSTEPIALVNKEPAPETGQALYQEPDTIKREAAPTGDLYAQPDKPRRNAPSKPDEPSKELPTYQDPNTIQRTQAPAMDYLYAEVDKKKEQQQQAMYAQVDKERKGGDGTVYADLALSNTGGQAGYPGATNPSAVIYSDVNMK